MNTSHFLEHAIHFNLHAKRHWLVSILKKLAIYH
jgi:hypothetical protein